MEPKEPVDLCVPIYLNQQIVFDLLAIFEDGFSQLSKVKTSSEDTDNKKVIKEASLGLGHLNLFGITLAGKVNGETGTNDKTESYCEKVHTSTSLFANLRLKLNNKNMLIKVQNFEDVNKITSSQFVEFRVILRKNPLVDTMERVKQMAELWVLFSDEAKGDQKSGKHSRIPQNNATILMNKLDGMLAGLNQSNSLELVGDMIDAQGVKVVLSTKLDNFVDHDSSDIIDGEFRVLGKIIRVISPESEESINLLRKTSFGSFDTKIFNQLENAFVGAEEKGIIFPKIETNIRGPALQIIPIAIFT